MVVSLKETSFSWKKIAPRSSIVKGADPSNSKIGAVDRIYKIDAVQTGVNVQSHL